MDASLAALAGAALGVVGTIGSAMVTRRGEARHQYDEARRNAYSACTTALMEWEAAVETATSRAEAGDAAAARDGLATANSLRGAVTQTAGAVMVDGPELAARSVKTAFADIAMWADVLDIWITFGLPEDQTQNMITDLRLKAKASVEIFTDVAYASLHGRKARKELIEKGQRRENQLMEFYRLMQEHLQHTSGDEPQVRPGEPLP
ncbi:hypothetical protein [Streptomyces sp. NPDC001978]|uniref:hypothetical protein n=1 Tax=Streptomyces sp. NPDC001978 TaxID=3364627 RepID=UPI0036B11526